MTAQTLPQFDEVSDPVASIVIPVFGKWPMTLECLRSLAADDVGRPYEVIVVDDCSLDDTWARANDVTGLVAVRTPTNLGFVGACNAGAARARGRVIVFLNNDTLVHSGWLDALLDVLDRDATVGLVGSLLLSPDGSVQEAGVIVWADGTAWNYGRGLTPDFAEVRAVRDVDYCSGAAIAIPADLFRELAGFDQRYAPAYYEDTDLAFAVREAGYRVVVQPESVITHLAGASNGTDKTGGLKRFQAVNREVFLRKWSGKIADHGQATWFNGPLWAARNRRPGGMVLIADPNVPMPDHDSGSRRMGGIIDELIDMGYAVYLAPLEHQAIQPYTRNLEQRGVTVLVTVEEQDRFIREAGRHLTAAIVCRPNVAWAWLERLYRWAPQARIVYDTVDLHALRLERQAELTGDSDLARLAGLIWEMEAAAMRAADVTLVVSPVERALLSTLMPEADVRVLSNIHQPVVTDPTLDGRTEIVFVGGYQHEPNVDAAVWLVNEVMPLVRAQVSSAILRLVGSHMPKSIAALDAPGVIAHGWADDLAPIYRAARVVVAPLRYGAGVKGKVAEAIEHGVPLVGTKVALEGMALVPETDVLVADSATEIADAIVTLLVDDDRWTAMAGSGQDRIHEQFSPKVARTALEQILALEREPKNRPLAGR